jgi:hypothetical protein
MRREALVIGPDDFSRSLATSVERSGNWCFTSARRTLALERLRLTSGLPDCMILHVRAMDRAAASELAAAASAADVRIAIAADHEVTQMRTLFALAQTAALEFIPSATKRAGVHHAFFSTFPRTSIHSRFVHALSPRLSQLPDPSFAVVCHELIPHATGHDFADRSRKESWEGGGAKPLATLVRSRFVLKSPPSASGSPSAGSRPGPDAAREASRTCVRGGLPLGTHNDIYASPGSRSVNARRVDRIR